jgi:hypothetical protein
MTDSGTDFGRMTAGLFRMDEGVWERHASPWSVWTRVASLPVLLLAIWSHAWFGAWAIAFVVLVILWLWLNPRIFPAPERTDRWSAKAVMGERVWLNRNVVPIPAHHARMAIILSTISAVGFFPALVGAYINDLLPTVAGGLVAFLAKMWFCDRMVWLFEDMRRTHAAYAAWVRTGKEEPR